MNFELKLSFVLLQLRENHWKREKIIVKIIPTCWNTKSLSNRKRHAHWKTVINDWTYQWMTQSATKSSHNLQCFHSWKMYYQFRLNVSLSRLEIWKLYQISLEISDKKNQKKKKKNWKHIWEVFSVFVIKIKLGHLKN